MDTTLTIAAYNLSAAAVKHHPDAVINDIVDIMSVADILLATETGMATDLLKRLDKHNLYVYQPVSKPGQKDTAIISRRKPRKCASDFLTPATDVGEAGAGPATLHSKWMNRSKFRFYGRTVWAAVLHTSPSVYIKKRFELAKRQFQGAANGAKRLFGFKVVGGDLNSEPNSPLRNPLEQVGLISAQHELGEKNTMKGRCIDDQHYSKNAKFRAVKHWVRHGASDHLCYFVTYEVVPSRLWKLRHKFSK